DEFAAWYAPTVLGGPLDQWAQVTTAGQLDAWLDQHPRSVIGLFSRFATAAAGLHRVGHGSQNLLSRGLHPAPPCPPPPPRAARPARCPARQCCRAATATSSTTNWSANTPGSPGSPTTAPGIPGTRW